MRSFEPMSLSQLPHPSTHKEQEQDETISARRAPNHEDFEPPKADLTETQAESTQTPTGLPAIWQPLHTASSPALRAREKPSYHSTATRRHWKRSCIRRGQRKATYRNRLLVVVGLFSAIIPLLLLITVIGGLIGGGFLYYFSQRDALANIASTLPADSLKIYDAQGNVIYELADHGSQTTVPLSQIPKVLQNATIAIEDKDFWTNQGVDFLAAVRAATDDLRSGQIVSGASTITQQLIKRGILGPQVTFDRKLREMILAIGLTHQMSKQDILNLYLNTIYYGEQAYGIDAAAQTYFGLQDQPGHPAASQLDLAQAAMLAGLPQSPSDLDPLVNVQAALNRQQAVLGQMVAQGYITAQQELARSEERRVGKEC